jgi:hypothetical protein
MTKVASTRVFILTVLALTLFHSACGVVPTTEELKTYFEIIDFKSKWVKKYYSPWPEKLTLAPEISFQVKNLSDKPLKFVYFNAIFTLRGVKVVQGDALYSAMTKEPLTPGEVSDVITMRSNYGVEGKRLNDFKGNPAWEVSSVKLFVKLKGSRYAQLGEWNISKDIDFKPDEPLKPKKK